MKAIEYLSIIEQQMENENIPTEIRESLYRACAISCVKDTVLLEHKKQFEECNRSLDLQYEKYGNTEYFFGRIIEAGHIYEIGYPFCVCEVVEKGACLRHHCECSRQSILYVLGELMPEKKISVTTIETVLNGGKECRFRVEVES